MLLTILLIPSPEFISSLSFSPTETSILYIAEGNPPVTDDPYQKFRFTPQFGEGMAGKRQPTIFIFRWSDTPGQDPTRKITSLSVPAPALFGQAVFSPHANTIYATGYEYTSDHRLLGVQYCNNRPSGIWELKSPLLDTDPADESPTLKCSARKLTPSNISCRSPRVSSHEGRSSLIWLSSPTGGAHAATSVLYSLDITTLQLYKLPSPGVRSLTVPLEVFTRTTVDLEPQTECVIRCGAEEVDSRSIGCWARLYSG